MSMPPGRGVIIVLLKGKIVLLISFLCLNRKLSVLEIFGFLNFAVKK